MLTISSVDFNKLKKIIENKAWNLKPIFKFINVFSSNVSFLHFIAYRGDEVVGYICLLNNSYYVIDVFVPYDFDEKEVIKFMFNSLNVDSVKVEKTATNLIDIYKELGFKNQGSSEIYYIFTRPRKSFYLSV